MIAVKKHGILLSPTDHEFENNGVFNPGIFQIDNKVHILYRAVQNGNFSTIGYAKTEGPLQLIERNQRPLLIPEFDYEKQGIEDPRIVKIDSTYYITYTAYDGINAMGAVATSKDLISFEKLGIVTPRINYRQYAKLVKCCNHSMNPKYHHFHQLFEQIGLAGEKFRYPERQGLGSFPKKNKWEICPLTPHMARNSNRILRRLERTNAFFLGRVHQEPFGLYCLGS